MISDEEKARADAEYAAIPGTAPDHTRQIDVEGGEHAVRSRIQDTVDLLRKEGCRYFRYTLPPDEPNRGYVEGWKTRPLKEAEFNPRGYTGEKL